jgi:hypothetical protein
LLLANAGEPDISASWFAGTNQIDDQSTTMDEAVHPELSQTGVPVGHKYGFCFVPYPSVKTTFLTRCVPHIDADSEDIERALSNFNVTSTYSTDGASSMVTGFEGVMAGFNSPSETFNTLMNEVSRPSVASEHLLPASWLSTPSP